MDKKPTRNERRKASRGQLPADADPTAPTPGEVVRQRRNRRMIFLGVIAVLLPLLEVAAYQFRSILFIVVNDSDAPVHNVKVTYPGGSFEAKELKAGGELTHAARPDYTFTAADFSTYRTLVSFATADGGFIRQMGRTGTVDYSARETFSIQRDPANNNILAIKHTTYPGFPLGTFRTFLKKLGAG